MVSLINKRVGRTDSVALTTGSGRYVITGTFRQTVTVASVCTGSGHYKLGTDPIPSSSMYIDHI